MNIEILKAYTPAVGADVRRLLIQLSRSGTDKGEIPESWFQDIIASPWHDLLVAKDGDKIIGMASLSINMGPGIQKNAYLEDFVVDVDYRGQGVSSALWQAMLDWAREKGAKRMEFTCGDDRDAAQNFYKNHGATIYKTNFFRVEL